MALYILIIHNSLGIVELNLNDPEMHNYQYRIYFLSKLSVGAIISISFTRCTCSIGLLYIHVTHL
jgi:hypothetical protein